MTKLFLNIMVAFLAISALAGCSGEELDGDWDLMKWKTEVKVGKGGYVEVPKAGGTYQWTCKNYHGFWLSGARETASDGSKKSFWIYGTESDFNHLTTTWSTIKAEERVLTVTIAPNETDSTRILEVQVTAGDIFDQFNFRQE